jgi:hypothetical protein
MNVPIWTPQQWFEFFSTFWITLLGVKSPRVVYHVDFVTKQVRRVEDGTT